MPDLTRGLVFLMLQICTAVLAMTVAGPFHQFADHNDEQYWWPQFRGPNASGIAEDGEYPVEFGADKNLLWKISLPSGHSSPCIWGNHIFLTGFDETSSRLETLCLNRTTGKLMWRRDANAPSIEEVNLVSSPASPTPATDGQRVYVYFGSCGLLCYDFDGNELWTKRLPIPETKHGSSTSPIVVQGKVILKVDQIGRTYRDKDNNEKNETRSFLMAVNSRSGEIVWKRKRPSWRATYSVPVVWNNGASTEVLVQGRSRLMAYELENGELKWWSNQMPPTASSTPVIGNGHVFVAGQDNLGEPDNVVTLPAFDSFLKSNDENENGVIESAEIPTDFSVIGRGREDGAGSLSLRQWSPDVDKNGIIDRKEWNRLAGQLQEMKTKFRQSTAAIRLGGTRNVTQTHISWQNAEGIPEVPSPLFHENRIFYVKNGGIVYCRSAVDGEVLFKGRLGVTSNFFSSPVVANNNIYTASESGVIVVFEAGDALNILSRNDLGERIMATPALVEGGIYVRGSKHLYAFAK